MKYNKTVVILTPGFPADEEDTTCLTFLQDYVISFSRLYPDIKLFIVSFQYPFVCKHYSWNGVDVFSAGGRNRKYFFKLLTWIRVVKEVFRIRKISNEIVFHSLWLTECTLVAQWISGIFKIKHIAYIIGQDATVSNKYLRLLNFYKIHLVAMSPMLADNIFRLTKCQVNNIIPLGVDPYKAVISTKVRDMDVIGVGSLTSLKNYSLFVDIIGELKTDFRDIKSCLIGKGPEREKILLKIQEKNLTHHLQLVGEVSHLEVFEWMQKSKILLHTSEYEGQSTVMMEALSAGLHIVCFNVGRFHSEGRITVCENKEQMTKALKRLLLNHELPFEPLILQTMDDTVKSFARLYGI